MISTERLTRQLDLSLVTDDVQAEVRRDVPSVRHVFVVAGNEPTSRLWRRWMGERVEAGRDDLPVDGPFNVRRGVGVVGDAPVCHGSVVPHALVADNLDLFRRNWIEKEQFKFTKIVFDLTLNVKYKINFLKH